MPTPVVNNKKARFEYEILETFQAGIVLQGSEIKSIRQGKSSIKESHCAMENGELWIRNMHIAPYEEASINNHEPLRQRKLLVNATEIKKITRQLRDSGITIVPLKVFIAKSGYAKVEIALAKGKKLYDKRDSIKQKDVTRQMAREQKGTL